MESVAPRFMTEQDYLEAERRSLTKHEWRRGLVVAMSGGSPRRNLIASKLLTALNNALAGRRCVVLPSDQRVYIQSTGAYTYPDITVTCEKPVFHTADRDSLANPRVIVEVLSKSTEAYDRGHKFADYRTIPSLQRIRARLTGRTAGGAFSPDGDGSVDIDRLRRGRGAVFAGARLPGSAAGDLPGSRPVGGCARVTGTSLDGHRHVSALATGIAWVSGSICLSRDHHVVQDGAGPPQGSFTRANEQQHWNLGKGPITDASENRSGHTGAFEARRARRAFVSGGQSEQDGSTGAGT